MLLDRCRHFDVGDKWTPENRRGRVKQTTKAIFLNGAASFGLISVTDEEASLLVYPGHDAPDSQLFRKNGHLGGVAAVVGEEELFQAASSSDGTVELRWGDSGPNHFPVSSHSS